MGLLIPLVVWLGLAEISFAPPLPMRPTAGNTTTSTNSISDSETASLGSSPAQAEPQENEEIRRPVEEKVMRATLPAAHTPARHGETEGSYWIGQRTLVEDYCGWGWLRKEGEGWNQARWIAIEYEQRGCPATHAFLPRPGDDKDYLYQLYGDFAPYRAYEPQADVWVDVFKIKGFVSLGPAKNPILREPPAHGSSKPNRFAERGANLR